MTTPWLIIKPLLVGLFSGWISVIPVGPINVTIVHKGMKDGFWSAFLIGLGAVCMELIYCTLAITGIIAQIDSVYVRAGMELVSFILITFLGIRFLVIHKNTPPVLSETKIENKIYSQARSSFLIGFTQILFNPIVLLFWITMGTGVISSGLIKLSSLSKTLYICGIGIGMVLWFWFLAFHAAKYGQKFSDRTLAQITRISGILLLLLSIIICRRIFIELSSLN